MEINSKSLQKILLVGQEDYHADVQFGTPQTENTLEEERSSNVLIEMSALLTCESLNYLAEKSNVIIPRYVSKEHMVTTISHRVAIEKIEDFLNQFRYAGDISITWYKITSFKSSRVEIKDTLCQNIHRNLFEKSHQPSLIDRFQLVQAREISEGILLKFGMSHPEQYYFESYERKSFSPSTFVYALIRPEIQLIEIRSNYSNCKKIRKIIAESLRIPLLCLNPIEILRHNHFIEQLWNMLDAKLYWAKAFNEDDAEIEIEAQGLNKFRAIDMLNSKAYQEHRYKAGIQKRARFAWNGITYQSTSIALGIDQRHASLKFFSHVPEEVIKYVLDRVIAISVSDSYKQNV